MENSFNINLKRIRKEKGITQEQLADKVGVSPQAVSKWELSSYPDPQLFPAIADFLGVTIDELFGRAPEKEMSVYSHVVSEIYNTPYTEDGRKDRIECAYQLVRAAAMANCGNNYFDDIPDIVLNSKYDIKSNSTAITELRTADNANAVNNNSFYAGNGGKGAGGAMIIKW